MQVHRLTAGGPPWSCVSTARGAQAPALLQGMKRAWGSTQAHRPLPDQNAAFLRCLECSPQGAGDVTEVKTKGRSDAGCRTARCWQETLGPTVPPGTWWLWGDSLSVVRGKALGLRARPLAAAPPLPGRPGTASAAEPARPDPAGSACVRGWRPGLLPTSCTEASAVRPTPVNIYPLSGLQGCCHITEQSRKQGGKFQKIKCQEVAQSAGV